MAAEEEQEPSGLGVGTQRRKSADACLQVRRYLERKRESTPLGGRKTTGGDVVHDQVCYLTDEDIEALQAEGVATWVIEQRLGEAVFIPAGARLPLV